MARLAAVALMLVLAGAGTALVLLRDDEQPARGPAPTAAPPAPSAPPAPQPRIPVVKPVPDGPLAARILRRTQLRSSPGGRVVKAIGTTTGYTSARVLAVVERRGSWLGVLSDHVPNSRTAWIPADSAELVHVSHRLDVDLSARRVLVRREGRVVRRVSVAIGLPNTATPTGRFAVTDTLRIGGDFKQYGCCALALTGRQPNLPQGWGGGDRLAIHGTTATGSIGKPASFGCMRASDRDMRWLLRTIRPGMQVHIRA